MNGREVEDKFWIDDPIMLVKSYRIFPEVNMSYTSLLNTMTRLIIVISLLLLILSFGDWWLFLILGIVMVCIMWYFSSWYKPKITNTVRVENYTCKKPRSEGKTIFLKNRRKKIKTIIRK